MCYVTFTLCCCYCYAKADWVQHEWEVYQTLTGRLGNTQVALARCEDVWCNRRVTAARWGVQVRHWQVKVLLWKRIPTLLILMISPVNYVFQHTHNTELLHDKNFPSVLQILNLPQLMTMWEYGLNLQQVPWKLAVEWAGSASTLAWSCSCNNRTDNASTWIIKILILCDSLKKINKNYIFEFLWKNL